MALDPVFSVKIGAAESKLQAVEKVVNDEAVAPSLDALNDLQVQSLDIKRLSTDCIDKNESSINKNAKDLELLGEPSDNEAQEIIAKRKQINQEMLSSAQQLANCRLILLRVQEVLVSIEDRQKTVLAKELLASQSNILYDFREVLLNPNQTGQALMDFLSTKGGGDTVQQEWQMLLGLVAVALVIALLIRRKLKQWLHVDTIRSASTGYLSQLSTSFVSCGNRYLISLVVLGFLSLWFLYRLYHQFSLNFMHFLVFGFFLYAVTGLVIRALLQPCEPAKHAISLPEDVSVHLALRLRLLARQLLAGFLVYGALQIYQFPPGLDAVLGHIFLVLLVLNMIWAIWLLRFYRNISNLPAIRFLVIFGLLLCLPIDWFGYQNLSYYILWGIGGAILLWVATLFVLGLWSDFMDGLDEGRSEWQLKLRNLIDVKEGEFIPGSLWFRFSFALVMWSVFALLVMKVWGVPDSTLIKLREILVNGFTLGSVPIIPLKVLFAVISFAVLLSLIGWIKRRMDKSWLKRSRMDRGSKEAMISLTGYFGLAMAFLIALSVAGVQLASIALIAGALSVGIGFGLQNIVNNFVSGVILLFERPIKTGDWIVVGETQGYVKKISIRSTQIQTFDRSDVIIPNSELISGQVTNWMFRDSIGRVIVPIGVAYKSDPDQVKEILLKIAYEHPDVITESPILPKPWVFFKEFGDSSLNFELRCFINVVDNRLTVISDINFLINRALKEAGIEIPYPQRDVHLIPTDSQ